MLQRKNDFSKIIGLSNTRELEFSNSNNILLCISRAIICFLLTIGGICGYASCFGAQFNLNLIMIVLFIFSLLISFVRNMKSALIKNILYIIMFFVFFVSIMKNFQSVNSGYHALVNLSYAALEYYLEIPALVYYQEIIENSYMTITYFIIFLGLFELLVFHMCLGERLNLLTFFIISFAPFAIPLYINLYPEEFYIICLMISYISACLIGLSGHIKTKHRKKRNYIVQSKFNLNGFYYGANGLSYFATLCISTLIAIGSFLLINAIVPYSTYTISYTESQPKQKSKENMKYLVTFGLSGYINRYSSTGGLSNGRLGGIYSVRPDYETDLEVTFIPTSYEPVYLRGFVGIGYTDKRWHSVTSLADNIELTEETYNILLDDIELSEEFELLENNNLYNYPFKMDIKNIDASRYYLYKPYYSNSFDSNMQIFNYYTTNSYSYYPYNSISDSNSLSDNTSELVLSACLQVPEETRRAILKYLYNNHVCTDYIVEKVGTNRNIKTEELTSIINELSDTLTNDFTYSLNPGITPSKYDFVDYFLNNTKKGYCSYFATSATLILRTLGIPARYVEGYVITSDDLASGSIIENANSSEYMDTANHEILPVVNVQIGDDKAHAWVEYYDPAFGWRVFEATTASMEATVNTDFWSSLFNAMNGANQTTNNDITNSDIVPFSISKLIKNIIIIMFSVVVILYFLSFAYKRFKLYRSYHRHLNSINVRNYYKIIVSLIEKRHVDFVYITSMSKQLDFICTHYKLSKKFSLSNIDKLCIILEKAAFSNIEISAFEYKFAMKLLKLLRINITFSL